MKHQESHAPLRALMLNGFQVMSAMLLGFIVQALDCSEECDLCGAA